jgi:hypothetical protein
MDKRNTLQNQSNPPSPDKNAAREAELAADAKAEELRAVVQSKGEQGKSELGFLPVDSEE